MLDLVGFCLGAQKRWLWVHIYTFQVGYTLFLCYFRNWLISLSLEIVHSIVLWDGNLCFPNLPITL